MKLAGGRIFVVTAGMMSEHTAAHDLAARMMGDPRHGIFFVGYADPDTPGGQLKASKPGKPLLFSPGAGQLTRKCEVQDFDLSAHANRDELLDFVGEVSPRVVLLGHGDAEAREWFAEQIAERHPKIRVIQPRPGLLVDV
jgi:Cft2 family RNA processing exonuclease